ncbi:Pseudouridine-5'-phosphatase [Gryllus bimaculatus]|nr:Pseudouridine-5'-phosphatase [Gryllus bimaculatus]
MHEVPMAMATSNPYPHMDAKLTNYPEVRLAFHHIVCGGTDPEVKMGKPAPDIFLVAASRFPGKPQPAQVLVFEDSVAGVKGAIAAGMHVVAVPDRTVPHDTLSGATIILDSLAHFHPELFGFPPF